MNFAVEEGTDRQHHRLRTEFEAHLGHRTDNTIVFDDQILNRLLEDHQVRLVLQRGAYCLAIEHAIRLSTGRPHGGAFARV